MKIYTKTGDDGNTGLLGNVRVGKDSPRIEAYGTVDETNAILGVILINGLFSFWQEYRAERALAALVRLLPHQAKVMRDGAVVTLPVVELVPGDIVLFEGGVK